MCAAYRISDITRRHRTGARGLRAAHRRSAYAHATTKAEFDTHAQTLHPTPTDQLPPPRPHHSCEFRVWFPHATLKLPLLTYNTVRGIERNISYTCTAIMQCLASCLLPPGLDEATVKHLRLEVAALRASQQEMLARITGLQHELDERNEAEAAAEAAWHQKMEADVEHMAQVMDWASSKLAAVRRGQLARRLAAQRREQQAGAATKLQAMCRSKTARRDMRARAAAVALAAEHASARAKAATQLQAFRRGKVARAVVRIEAAEKASAARAATIGKAATRLQARHRGRAARRKMSSVTEPPAAVAPEARAAAVAQTVPPATVAAPELELEAEPPHAAVTASQAPHPDGVAAKPSPVVAADQTSVPSTYEQLGALQATLPSAVSTTVASDPAMKDPIQPAGPRLYENTPYDSESEDNSDDDSSSETAASPSPSAHAPIRPSAPIAVRADRLQASAPALPPGTPATPALPPATPSRTAGATTAAQSMLAEPAAKGAAASTATRKGGASGRNSESDSGGPPSASESESESSDE